MTIRVINFSDDIESALTPQDITIGGGHTIKSNDGTALTQRINLRAGTGLDASDNVTGNESILFVTNPFTEADEAKLDSLNAGRLEVTVINNSGAALTQFSAYSLEDNAWTLADNTVRLTATRTGIPTQGQTALFFCQDAIPNGSTGIGVIKGLITTTVLQSNDVERDLKVLPSGGLSDIVLEGEYVIGVVTRSPLLDTPLEIAFDGLSVYKFVVNSDTLHVTEVENNGTRIGTDTLNKINFSTGVTAVQDPMDSTRAIITVDASSISVKGTAVQDPNFIEGTGIALVIENTNDVKITSTATSGSIPFMRFNQTNDMYQNQTISGANRIEFRKFNETTDNYINQILLGTT